MSAPTMDLDLREKHEQAEQRCAEAAEAERAAYLHWQEAYGAYEVARSTHRSKDKRSCHEPTAGRARPWAPAW